MVGMMDAAGGECSLLLKLNPTLLKVFYLKHALGKIKGSSSLRVGLMTRFLLIYFH